ncbi:MAG: SpoIIE family protein phosphatase [Pseudomonadota bacterium]
MAVDMAEEGPQPRVLVVDDSPTQRLLISAQLRGWGYKVTQAGDGMAALETLSQQPHDIVLSDWMMPGLDGPTLCSAIRERTADRYVYLVLLTSRGRPDDVSAGLNAGADDFLSKPFAAAELSARLAAGARVIAMERRLAAQKKATEKALAKLDALYRAVDADLQAAAVLQREQLPPPSAEINGFNIATYCRFHGHVGGDHIGFFPIGEQGVGIFSIDVAGHGVASALLAIRLAQFMSGTAPDENIAIELGQDGQPRPRPPEEVIADLNARCHVSLNHDIYFTMAYGVIDRLSGRVCLSQAGHSPAARLARDGSVRFSEIGAGPPVGLLDDAVFTSGTFTLEPGERLILYTDGVTEAGVQPIHCGAGAPEHETAPEKDVVLTLEGASNGAEATLTAAPPSTCTDPAPAMLDQGPDGGLEVAPLLGTDGFAKILKECASETTHDLLPAVVARLTGEPYCAALDDDLSALVIEWPGRARL